jgi:tripartite-type tricarboxylate transporter receptor subunit TctC
LIELGFDQFSAPQWLGFVAPRTMGDNRVSELSHQLEKALADPATHQRLGALGCQPLFQDGPAMSLRIAGEEQRWRSIVAAARLTRQ